MKGGDFESLAKKGRKGGGACLGFAQSWKISGKRVNLSEKEGCLLVRKKGKTYHIQRQGKREGIFLRSRGKKGRGGVSASGRGTRGKTRDNGGRGATFALVRERGEGA